MSLPTPPTFLVHRAHHDEPSPGLTGLCVGYEMGVWRMTNFADHLIDWIPEFALSWSELQGINPGNARQLVRKAAQAVYNTDKYKNRGEFGELMLHAAVRQVFGSFPAISKIYYKDSANDTVKGFDCVHTVVAGDTLELWLGEAKFYSNVTDAVRNACDSLTAHKDRDYLRAEFAAILNKLDPQSPSAARLYELLRPETSLDTVFDAIVVPVLLTYDSAVVGSYDSVSSDYIEALEKELQDIHERFCDKNPLVNMRVHLFLVPLEEKKRLRDTLHEKLRLWQIA